MFIIITVVVVGIVVVWKRRKSEQDTKSEGVYYSTIDETTLQRSPTIKPEPVYNEMNDEQDSNYIEISKSNHSTKQMNKVTMQDNPAYCEHQVKTKISKSAQSTEQADKVTIQDNPAYSILSEDQIKMNDNPAYSVSFDSY